jgi:hypothetical protein
MMQRLNKYRGERDSIGIYLESTKQGFLKGIYFDANVDKDFKVLQGLLERLTRPGHFGWMKKIFS